MTRKIAEAMTEKIVTSTPEKQALIKQAYMNLESAAEAATGIKDVLSELIVFAALMENYDFNDAIFDEVDRQLGRTWATKVVKVLYDTKVA